MRTAASAHPVITSGVGGRCLLLSTGGGVSSTRTLGPKGGRTHVDVTGFTGSIQTLALNKRWERKTRKGMKCPCVLVLVLAVWLKVGCGQSRKTGRIINLKKWLRDKHELNSTLVSIHWWQPFDCAAACKLPGIASWHRDQFGNVSGCVSQSLVEVLGA